MSPGTDDPGAARRTGRLALGYLASVLVTVSLLQLVGAAMDRIAPAPGASEGLALYYGVAIASAGFAYLLAAVCGLAPALVWIAVSERKSLRQPLGDAAAGAIWAAAGWLGFSLVTDSLGDPLLARVTMDLLIAGAGGGLAYWVVAGRSAGSGTPRL